MHNSKYILFYALSVPLFCFLFFTACQRTQSKVETPVQAIDLAPNGAWVWHTDPVTIWHDDRLFFAYVDSENDGRIMVSSYDPKTEKIYPIEVSTDSSYATDSHDHPAFAVLPDSNLYIAYNRHSTDKGFFFRRSMVNRPEKIGDFSQEQFYEIDTLGAATTYNNLYYLKSEKRLHYFGRWLNWKPTWATSIDQGKTWSKPSMIINNAPGRPYVHYASNLEDRIDMIYTDGHPRDKQNSIYHLYYRNDSFYTSAGKKLADLNTLPVENDIHGSTVIYQYSDQSWSENNSIHDWIPYGIAWVWDLEYNEAGEPVCVFSVRRSGSDKETWEAGRIFYYYAWWTEEIGWQKRCIAQGGNALYEIENDFAGGLCLNPDDPTEVYVSTNAQNPFDLSDLKAPLYGNNEYKIYKGRFDHDTKAFKGKLFYEKKGHMAIRPLMPRGNKAYKALLWMEGKEYTDFTRYKTGLKASIIKQQH